MKNKLFAFIFVITAFFGFMAVAGNDNKQCINVYVDYGSLNNGTKVIGCIDAVQHTAALDLLSRSNIKVDGTDKYGLQVVCRVNGLPGPKRESCSDMPPENAYWAVIIKQNKTGILSSKWGWAQTGIDKVYLNPGDSLGLVFTENGDIKWPE
jgi:hypothetical protein